MMPTIVNSHPSTTYTAGAGLDPMEQTYSRDELCELLEHWGAPSGRELADGRVVPLGWDPADGDPEVYARVSVQAGG